ncbi:peptidase M14 [uncultured Jannaschia sp.]|uniref:peptidase M14 n=1 Tax=uncultured Jannaschia sp. TaxID=293347 RepID=UPI00260790E0|nr:peptidase M14 [uncultured Jannaschia sp.]
MTPLDETFPRALDALLSGATTLWLFEDGATRAAAERSAAEAGRAVRIRSAYKTLLHDVLEDGVLDGARRAVIRYPVLPGVAADRFRLECYPLHALVPDCEIAFVPDPQDGPGLPVYTVETEDARHSVPVPVRRRAGADGRTVLGACGWAARGDEGMPLETEYEAIFERACAAMRALPPDPAAPDGPFFPRLDVEVTLPVADMVLPVGHERISLAEAMHEEIYFAGLEIFRQRLGLPPGERSVRCGQIVPRVVIGDVPRLQMRLNAPEIEPPAPACPEPPDLGTVSHWLSPAEIAGHLDRIGGVPFAGRSRQGRAIPGRFVKGTGRAALAISGGQHANESTGIVGALRAARDLAAEGRASFTVTPLENPDGYAVFRALCRDRPHDMHHAARYTASGADLGHARDCPERNVRDRARAHLSAEVHLNLHGYPSHEWTRPLSGYIPEGFAGWTVPKGFFLILRHAPEAAALGRLVLDAALDALAACPEIAAQNRRMLSLYDRYVSERAFRVHAGCVPYVTGVEEGADYPVTLITEAPDETVDGAAFRLAQAAHARVVSAVAAVIG